MDYQKWVAPAALLALAMLPLSAVAEDSFYLGANIGSSMDCNTLSNC